MHHAQFRFYAELNDFLPRSRRGTSFVHAFAGSPSVKDAIESLGVPHAEVDLILADGESVDFGSCLRNGMRVAVYPTFESLDVASLTRVRPAPLRDLRFVLDGHLGRLARHLRMAGFDVRWRRDAGDEELAGLSAAERRVLLTRDRGLLKRSAVTHGYFVREVEPARQLAEVIRRFDLARQVAPFRRCLRCNDLVETVPEEAVAGQLPPRVRERQRAFRRCPACGRIYWAGTHHRRMERLLEEILAEAGGPPGLTRRG
jgi:hypothetical protein